MLLIRLLLIAVLMSCVCDQVMVGAQEKEGAYGIGIKIELKDPSTEQPKVSEAVPLVVTEPLPGSPAVEAGLRQGDKIVQVDGEPIKGLTLAEVVGKLRGKKDTPVRITVLREDGGKAKQETISVVRSRFIE